MASIFFIVSLMLQLSYNKSSLTVASATVAYWMSFSMFMSLKSDFLIFELAPDRFFVYKWVA